jgi:hypothetical protein
MNKFMQEQWGTYAGTLKMRAELMDTLTDADLAFNPGGQALSLGALCRQQGEIDHTYIQSLKQLKQDFDYRNPDPALETSVARLKAWYAELEKELQTTLEAFSDEDLAKMIERNGFTLPVTTQMEVYLQALLIFFAKATVYLRIMNKPLTDKLRDWIW